MAAIELNSDRPAKLFCPGIDNSELVETDRTAGQIHDPGPADAGIVQTLHLVVAGLAADYGDTASDCPHFAKTVYETTVVGLMGIANGDHEAFDTEPRHHLAVLVRSRSTRGQGRSAGQGRIAVDIEMDLGVDGAGRQGGFRPGAGVGAKKHLLFPKGICGQS
jgi:hypothetical protein